MPFVFDSLVRRDFSGCDVLWFSSNQNYDPGTFVNDGPTVASVGGWLSSGTWLRSGYGNDVVGCSWAKTVAGRASGICVVQLKPGKPWDKLIKPGDAFVVFMTSTSGSTTTRTTFISVVFVDRVERGRVVDGSGATIQTVAVSARDMGKIFEETSTVYDPSFAIRENVFYSAGLLAAFDKKYGLSPPEMIFTFLDLLFNFQSTRSKYVEMQWRFPGAETVPIIALLDVSTFVQVPQFGYSKAEIVDLTAAGDVWTLLTSYSNDCVNEFFVDVRDVDEASLEHMNHQEGIAASFADLNDIRAARGLRDTVNSNLLSLAGGSSLRRIARANARALVGLVKGSSSSTGGPLPGRADFVTESLQGVNVFPGVPTTSRASNLFVSPGEGAAVPVTSGKRSTIALVMRQRPYDSGSFFRLPSTVLDETEIVQSNLGRAYHGVLNFFRFSSGALVRKEIQEMRFGIVTNPKSVSSFGLRRKEIQSIYVFRNAKLSVDFDDQSIRNYPFAAAYEYYVNLLAVWNAFNERFLEGTVVCKFRPDIRVGTRLEVVEHEASGKERRVHYYVQSVRHNFFFEAGASQTQLTLERGVENNDSAEANLFWTTNGPWIRFEQPYERFVDFSSPFVKLENEPGIVDPLPTSGGATGNSISDVDSELKIEILPTEES